MDKNKALTKLKDFLTEVENLRTLRHDNDEIKFWKNKVNVILEAGFGKESDEYIKFNTRSPIIVLGQTDAEEQRDYLNDLKYYELSLKQIIQKYEILGIAGDKEAGSIGDRLEEREKQQMIVDEMTDFRALLCGFAVLRKKLILESKKLNEEEEETISSLFNTLSIDTGKFSPLIKEVTGLDTIHTSAGPQDIWNWALNTEANTLVTSALDNCIAATSRTIGALQKDISTGIRDAKTGNLINKSLSTNTKPPKAFIAHGGRSGVLDKLCEFIEALGLEPLVVELLPSKGMSVDDKVNKYIKDADCGIVLATRGGIVDTRSGKTKQHPRLNIIDEVERLRAKLPERTILLLEKGVELPTNISGLTHEPFARQSMDRAFTAIARELREMGILKTEKPPLKE